MFFILKIFGGHFVLLDSRVEIDKKHKEAEGDWHATKASGRLWLLQFDPAVVFLKLFCQDTSISSHHWDLIVQLISYFVFLFNFDLWSSQVKNIKE